MKRPSLSKFKKTLIVSLLILSGFRPVFALEPQTVSSAYNHLLEVNEQWRHYQDFAPDVELSFANDVDRITYHLKMVCAYLRIHTPELTSDQQTQRQQLINALEVYAQAKRFPFNSQHPNRQPYFIDNLGTHCAVGYLMAYSGHEELALKISETFNYDFVEDIQMHGTNAWASRHGFSKDELMWIQPGYMPIENFVSIGDGCNGSVHKLGAVQNRLYILGSYSELDGESCSQLGYYDGYELHCIGSALNGVISDMHVDWKGLVVSGQFDSAGKNYPLASYKDSWTYLDIPDYSDAKVVKVHRAHNELLVAIEHPTEQKTYIILHKNFSGDWDNVGHVKGLLNCIAQNNQGVFYLGGHIDTIMSHSATLVVSAGAVSLNSETKQWELINGQVADTVHDILASGNTVYLAGGCDLNTAKPCMSRITNNVVQPVIQGNSYGLAGKHAEFKDVSIYNTSLVVSGEFLYSDGFTYGVNLGIYNLLTDQLYPIAVLNGPAMTAQSLGDELIVGGAFTKNKSTELNNLAKLEALASLDLDRSAQIILSPNPFVDHITITADRRFDSYKLFGLNGQLVSEGELNGNKIDQLEELSNGVYMLYLQSEDYLSSYKVLKAKSN